MKNIIITLFVLMNIPLFAQQTQDIKMRPHNVSYNEEEIFENLGLPAEWNCRIETCPEEIFKTNKMNLFALHDAKESSLNLKLATRIVKRMNANSDVYGFIQNGTLKIYKIGKGLVKEVEGIRVLAGDM